MNLLFRNFIRAGVAVTLLGAYTLNPQTAQLQDLFRLMLNAMHSGPSLQIFAMAWLLFCGLDVMLGFGGSGVAASRAGTLHTTRSVVTFQEDKR